MMKLTFGRAALGIGVMLMGSVAVAIAQDTPPAEDAAEEAEEAVEVSEEVMELGAAVYQRECVACHGAEGQGGAGTPVANNGFVGMTGPVLAQIVHGGAYMPAFLSLSDTDLAAVTTYIRNSFGNSFGPVTEEEVQAAR